MWPTSGMALLEALASLFGTQRSESQGVQHTRDQIDAWAHTRTCVGPEVNPKYDSRHRLCSTPPPVPVPLAHGGQMVRGVRQIPGPTASLVADTRTLVRTMPGELWRQEMGRELGGMSCPVWRSDSHKDELGINLSLASHCFSLFPRASDLQLPPDCPEMESSSFWDRPEAPA